MQLAKRFETEIQSEPFPQPRVVRGAAFPTRLTWKRAFAFPVETPEGRRDIWVGGLLILFLWPVGWILNLGNRLNVVSRFRFNSGPFPPTARVCPGRCATSTSFASLGRSPSSWVIWL